MKVSFYYLLFKTIAYYSTKKFFVHAETYTVFKTVKAVDPRGGWKLTAVWITNNTNMLHDTLREHFLSLDDNSWWKGNIKMDYKRMRAEINWP